MQSGIRREYSAPGHADGASGLRIGKTRSPRRCGALVARHKISLDPQLPDQWIGREAFLASFSALFSFMVLAGFFLASFF
jgi:hypothetical protein